MRSEAESACGGRLPRFVAHLRIGIELVLVGILSLVLSVVVGAAPCLRGKRSSAHDHLGPDFAVEQSEPLLEFHRTRHPGRVRTARPLRDRGLCVGQLHLS